MLEVDDGYYINPDFVSVMQIIPSMQNKYYIIFEVPSHDKMFRKTFDTKKEAERYIEGLTL